MMTTTSLDISAANAFAGEHNPAEIVRYGLEQVDGPAVVSTNFRPGEAAILHMCAQARPDITVLWIDHGYNLPETYTFAQKVIDQLQLKVEVVTPRVTAARRDATLGGIPSIDDEAAHHDFAYEAKIEPFKRGLAGLRPAIWLTAVRRDQSAFRQGMTHFSIDDTNLVDYDLIKVAPLLDWDEAAVNAYLDQQGLPDERVYFDPSKGPEGRECGLHPGLDDPAASS